MDGEPDTRGLTGEDVGCGMCLLLAYPVGACCASGGSLGGWGSFELVTTRKLARIGGRCLYERSRYLTFLVRRLAWFPQRLPFGGRHSVGG